MLHRKLSTADILIDDHTPNLHRWEEAGGLGVKWLNEINGNNGRFEGTRVGSTEELREVLDAACAGFYCQAGSACFRQAFGPIS